jgi:hypothetical protein
MTDEQLIADLATLGMDRSSWRAIVLLPVVQVAWADGQVQPRERELILRVAGDNGLLDGPGGTVIRSWLDTAPDSIQVATGRRLLVSLVHRHHGLGSELDPVALDDVNALCLQVAQAAGGLFDLLFTVEAAERDALQEIATAFGEQTRALLDDLPTPEGGQWTDLDEHLA